MRRIVAIVIAALAAAPYGAAAAPDEPPPLPRYESLRSDAVNARRGPSLDQPALWRYQRAGLPVKVIAESGDWRRVRDPAGDEGWVRADLLSARRTLLALGEPGSSVPLYARPRPSGRPKALLQAGVVARLEGCAGPWRKVRAGGASGWAHADGFWGAGSCTDPARS